MRLFDVIKLTIDHPQEALKAGAIGTLVEELDPAKVFLVEFDEGKIVELHVEHMALDTPFFREGERVALLDAFPNQPLQRGQVGRIVRYGSTVCTVSFEDIQGHPIITQDVPTHALMFLYWQPTQQSA